MRYTKRRVHAVIKKHPLTKTMKNFITKQLRAIFSPAFLILLILAFGMWLVSKLSYTYSTQIEVEVILEVDYSAGVWVDNKPIMVTLQAEGNGRDLLRYKLGFGQKITLPVSAIKFNQTDKNNPNIRQIDDESLRMAIDSRQNNFRAQMVVNTLEPLQISEIREVKLPVIPNIEYSCARQHIIDSPLEIIPDSVSIKAPVIMLDTLKRITTQQLKMNDMTNGRSGVLNILLPDGVVSEQQMVKYKIGVVGYTEITKELQIKHHQNRSIVSNPSRAVVKLKVPVNNNNIRFENLDVVTEKTPQRNSKDVYKLRLSGELEGVIDYSITPEFVRVMYIN